MSLWELLWNVVWPLVLYDVVTVAAGMILSEIGGAEAGVLLIQAVSAAVTAGILGIMFLRYCRLGRIWSGSKNRTWGHGSCSERADDSGRVQKFGGRKFEALLTWGLLGISGCLFFNGIMELSGLKQMFSGYQQTAGELFAPPLGLQVLAMGCLIPLAEELIFRGFLYGSLRRTCSFGMAAVVSSLIFGIYHGSVVQGIYAGGLALILSAGYEFSGDFMAPVVIHAISNLTSVVFERYHLVNENETEVLVLMVSAISGVLTLYLLFRMKNMNLKEDV